MTQRTKLERTLLGIIILLFILCFVALSLAGYYRILYNSSIQQGAKNTVTALEMVVACEQVGNVTSEQIKEQYIKTFILNKTGENG